MVYVIGQVLGIISTLCCLISPFFKKKWQMLVSSMVANALVALNLIMLDKVGSAVILNCVAIIQITISIFRLNSGKAVTKLENIIFLVAYVVLGSLGVKGILDILPIFGTLFFMLAVFQKDVQATRKLNTANALTYLLYYILVGSTAALGQVVSIAANVIAMYKNRAASQTIAS